MIVVLLVIALLCGGAAAFILWGHGLIITLMGAGIAASAAVFLAATVLVRLGARSAEPGQAANLIMQWLQRRDPR